MIARKNPDGSEGTGTLELMCQTAKARKETITISGCFVKNDKNLERFIQKHTSSSVDMDPFDKNKYCFYFFNALDSNYHELNPVTTTVTYYRYSETKIEKICEIKNPQIIKVNEHSFLVCDSKDLNDSKFLEKHSKRVMISQSLDVTKDIKGLSQDQQSKTKIKFIPFKIMHCKSNMYSCCIAESCYEDLEYAGPILLPYGNYHEYVVAGGYRKTDNGRISISIFGKNQDEKRKDFSDGNGKGRVEEEKGNDNKKHEIVKGSGTTNRINFPPGFNTHLVSMASLPNLNNPPFPIMEQGGSSTPRRDMQGSGTTNQINFPPGFSRDDDIRENFKKYSRYLLYLAKSLNDQWREVGMKLGLKNADLNNIARDHRAQVKEQAYQMLVKWITSCKGQPQVRILLDALNKADLKNLAADISAHLSSEDMTPEGIRVEEQLLHDITKDITKDWKFIGRYLGLEDNKIDQIEKNSYDNQYEQTSNMLFGWYQKEGRGATSDVLIRALQDAGNEGAATKVQALAAIQMSRHSSQLTD